MTQKDLDALPECGGFALEDVPGKPGFKYPVMRENFVLAWRSEQEEVWVKDEMGVIWDIGWHEGVRYKRRNFQEVRLKNAAEN